MSALVRTRKGERGRRYGGMPGSSSLSCAGCIHSLSLPGMLLYVGQRGVGGDGVVMWLGNRNSGGRRSCARGCVQRRNF